MDKTTQPTIRKKKKTLNACQRCRSRKIKCSGQDPCQHCVSRRFTCVFEDRPKKLVVSEDYLNELQNRASAFASRGLAEQPSTHLKSSTTSMPDSTDAHQRQHQHSSPHFSPSAKRQQSVSANDASNNSSSGRAAEQESSEDRQISVESQHAIGDEYRRLGHSSSWAFSRKIRNMINDVVTGGSPLHDAVPILVLNFSEKDYPLDLITRCLWDGAYGVPWRPHPIDFSGLELPMEDYAEYLTNTVSFTLDPLYYLFNKQCFLSKLRQFYADRAAGKDRSIELWPIQMLIVFAFGKSILAREAGSSGPAGALYFARAVEALPDSHRLYEEPILSIEILCMFALFMQAMDMRFAAYEYIGRAVRMCLTHGLNRRFDANRITRLEFDHRSRIWWSVYIIERRLCSLCGVPSSLHDEDIALSMPSIGGVDNQTIAFHVEISSQLGQILNVVYGLGLQRQLGGRFVAEIQSILHRLADTSTMLNKSMKIEFQRPTDTISRATASLHLLHHQCSILAIRPILFFLLQKKLTTSDSTLVLSDAVIGLLRVCVESALQVLKIIESLSNHKLVDLLLPFDLDAMFASAFVLVLIGIITPADAEQWDLSRTLQLMDEMMMRGIITAGPYKKDLIELSNLGQSLRNSQQRDLSHQHQQQSHQQNQGRASATPQAAVIPDSRPDVELNPQLEQDPIWSWMATDSSGLGVLQPSTIQSAIDGLNFDFLNDSSALEMGGCDWMWGSGSSNWTDAL